MNALHSNYVIGSPEHEMAIAEAFTRKRLEVFREDEVQVPEEDERYQAIKEYMKEITQDWPKAPISKSRFVDCYCTVFPRLVCNIVPGEGDTSLFINEIIKKAYFGPLKRGICGDITSEDTTLTIQNIDLGKFAASRQGPHTGSEMAVINNKEPMRIGQLDDPAVLKAQGTARVTFKGFLDNEVVPIEAEMKKDSSSIKLIVTICQLRGKILYDGAVTLTEKILPNGTVIPLENGATFNIHDTTEIERGARWVCMPFGLNAPFRGFEG